MMSDPHTSAVVFREEILKRFHTVLAVIETRKAQLRSKYAGIIEHEINSVVQAAWSTEPDFRNCANADVIPLSEELRVLAASAEFIRVVEIPNAERLLEAERRQAGRVIEIDRIYPCAEVVN